MRRFKLIVLLLLGAMLLPLNGCKKSGREVAEAVMGKTAKSTAKNVTKNAVEESAEKTLKTIGRKELRSLDWDDILKIIKKENINLANAISKLDGSFQKTLGKAMKNDYEFFKAITSSNTILDEFKILTKESPKAASNINLLKYFAKGKNLERRFGVPGQIADLKIIEEGSIVTLINKADNKVIGKLKDGIFTLEMPAITGSSLFPKESLLKKELIPNSTYKIRGKEGLSYLYHTDDLGRITKIEANGIDANALASNVVYLRENMNLGAEWTASLKKIRQTSKGNDIKATLHLKYADDGVTPSFAKADISANNKSLVSQSFENLDNMGRRAFTTADNAKVLDRVGAKAGLSAQKKASLLEEMGKDEELAKLIHSDPDFNVKRWLNTRNHVDQSKLAKTAQGRTVPNGRVYAGNVYYFNPHLNSGLNARLKNGGSVNLKKFGNLTYEDLIKLDKLYPDGVPFTKEGFPDFSKVAFKDKTGKTLVVNIGSLSGDSKKDIARAEALFQRMGYSWEAGYTWHHVENSTTLIRVPTAIHQLVDHAGGMSTHAKQEIIKQAA